MNSAFFASFGTQYCRHIYESFNGSLSDKSRKKLASSLHATAECTSCRSNKLDKNHIAANILLLSLSMY
jgi:hypothetical protein